MDKSIYHFLMGAISALSWIACFFFYKFYKRVHDRFFLFFVWAFAIFSIERLILSLQATLNEAQPLIYVLRLVGFLIIVSAILDKNRVTQRTSLKG